MKCDRCCYENEKGLIAFIRRHAIGIYAITIFTVIFGSLIIGALVLQ